MNDRSVASNSHEAYLFAFVWGLHSCLIPSNDIVRDTDN